MPKYKVLSPIEHDRTLYVPEGAWPADAKKEAASSSHGNPVPVNTSGVIQLNDQQAALLKHAIEPIAREEREVPQGRNASSPAPQPKKK